MDYESTLLTKPECLVYRLPPRTTVRGYRAADWGLDKPAWTGRMRVTAKGKAVSIKVIHPNPNQPQSIQFLPFHAVQEVMKPIT